MKCILAAIAVPLLSLSVHADIHVAPNGNDTNPGTAAAPFATLDRARLAVRDLNATMSADIVVQLAPGDYPVVNTIVFDEVDSGMNGHEVIYRASGNPGSSRLLGGQPVTNWQPYQGEIAMADLGLPSFHTLYENGRRAHKARFPNFAPDPDLPLARGDYLRATGVAGSHRQLQYAADAFDPSGWDLTGAQVHLWPGGKWAWFTDTVPIASIDPATRTITLAEDTRYDIHQSGKGSRYFVQGVLDLLDAPGEFHYDSSIGRLYYWPMDGPAANQEIIVPRVGRILSLQGSDDSHRAHNLRFEGLAFELTDFTNWFRHAHVSNGDSGEGHAYPQYDRQMTMPRHRTGAVRLANTDHITFDACVVRNTGYSGIYAFGYNQHNTFQRCHISHTGVHGIQFEGLYPGEGDVQRDNTVDNCLLHDVGELVGHGAGVQLSNAGHHEVSHCVIFNSPRYAVTLPGYVDIPPGDIYAFGNHIHHVRIDRCCQDSGDTAPIYGWGISDEPPYLANTFEQLLIDDTRAHSSMGDIAPNGVFLDNDTNGQQLTDIEVRNSQQSAYRTNGSSGHILTNVSWQSGYDASRMDYDTIGVRSDHPFPVPPMRLVGTDTESGIVLNWLPVANATSYQVYSANSAAGPWSLLDSGLTAPTFTIGGESSATPTFYRVTSTSPLGQESAPSLLASIFPAIGHDTGYGFEDCTAGNFTGSTTKLAGNGDWRLLHGTDRQIVIAGAKHGTPDGFFGNFAYGPNPSADTGFARKNDTQFNYDLQDTGTITLSFLLRGISEHQHFALAGDANGNGQIDHPGDEVAFSFGIAGNDWMIREANFGTSHTVAHGLGSGGSDTYEVRIIVDPTANAGEGSGSFSFRNISTGGNWTEAAGLQNINLALSRMDAAVRTPSTWDGLYVRLGDSGARVDNFVIAQHAPDDPPKIRDTELDGTGAFRIDTANLDPLSAYSLKRGNDLLAFSEPVGDPLEGRNSATFVDPSPPASQAFYRIEPQTDTP